MHKNYSSRRWLTLFGIIIICAQPVLAQKDKNKNAGIGMDKVELLYRDVLVTQTYSSGNSYSYNSKWPYARINGGEPMEIDRTASVLAKPFKGCKPALKEWNLYARERKTSSQALLWGIGGTVVLGIASVIIPAEINPDEPSPTLFFTGLGLSFGSLLTGIIIARNHNAKAKVHLEQSVIKYNEGCFKGPKEEPKKDSIASGSGTKPVVADANKAQSGIIDHYRDTAFVEILRDAPEKTSFWTAGIIPLNFDFSGAHYLTLRYGAEVQYQTPKFGIRADVKAAMVDNLHAEGYQGEQYVADPYIDDASGRDIAVADDYQKGLQASVQSWIAFGGKTVQKEESVFLGTSVSYGRNVENYTKFQVKTYKNWAARLGAFYYRSIQQSPNGISLVTDAPDATYTDPDTGETFTYSPYERELSNAAVMIRTVNVSVGIGRRKHGDLKFDLKNSKNKGIKNRTSLSEWYVDALFVPSMQLGRLDYFIFTYNPETHTRVNISVEPTPLVNLGGRIGYRSEGFSRHFGWGYQLEVGSRPGIKNSFDSWFNAYADAGLFFYFGGRR